MVNISSYLKTEPKTMKEQLQKHYEITLENGNGGHATGFYSYLKKETIQFSYEFPEGTFTLRFKYHNWFSWGYDPIDKKKQEEKTMNDTFFRLRWLTRR